MKVTRDLELVRTSTFGAVVGILKWLASKPKFWVPALGFVSRKFSQVKWDFFKANGKAHKLTFFVQNFMDASNLEEERVHACSFMVMTGQGPMSMCLHNAKRDEYILKPVAQNDGKTQWNPLTGKAEPASKVIA